MERNFYDDEFEDFLKQKVDQYSLYPSDKGWYGIFDSLHSHRRWYKAAGALLLITTLFFISLEIVSTGYQKAASNIVNDSISSSRSVTSSSSKSKSGSAKQNNIIIASNASPSALPPRNGKPANDDIPTGTGTGSDALPVNNTESTLPSATTAAADFTAPFIFSTASRKNIPASGEDLLPPESNLPVTEPSGNDATQEKNNSQEEKQMKAHDVNWLHDMAVIKLSPNNKKLYQLQFYVSPGASYRRLKTDKSNLKTMSAFPASGDLVNIDGIVDHHPSFSLEAGTSVLINLSDRFVLKGGLQLNYIKYDINAYKSSSERTAITLSRSGYSNIQDTITSYSSLRNLGGRYSQQLQNQYVQLSLPIGAEVRLLGNKRFQFNISGTVQPSFLIYNNTYLLTSDYANYIKQPGLVRKWNVNAAVEPYISYSTGGLRWQLGPQFRYQLLSSYSDRYPVREYLMEYGIKFGVSKTIR